MKTIDLIRWALTLTDEATTRFLGDMKDAPLTRPAAGVGNHPLWVIGHLAVVEGTIPHTIFGEPNPLQHWWPLFGIGSQPTDNAGDYPPFEEVFGTYRALRAKNVQRLEALSEEDLEQAPKVIPPGFEDRMKTIGRTFHLIALHQMFHLGQVSDARRAAGREPFM